MPRAWQSGEVSRTLVPGLLRQYPVLVLAGGQSRAIQVSTRHPWWLTGRHSHVSTRARDVSTPITHAVSITPFESVPHGSQAVVTVLGCPGPASVGHCQTPAPGPLDKRPSQRAWGLLPSESQRSQGSSRDCLEPPASCRHRPQPGLRPAVRPEPILTQARASATGATSTDQQDAGLLARSKYVFAAWYWIRLRRILIRSASLAARVHAHAIC